MNYGLMYDTLNFEQKSVFNKLINGENVFITGNAGTGKSYLIKAYNEYCSLNGINLVKTAPTGVAANEIGGATLHHQFKLKVGLDFKQPNKYPDFCNALDMCKKGDFDCLKFIGKNCAKKEIEDAIWLCGKNITAAQKNEDGLRKINGTLYSSQAKYEGNVTKADKLCDDVFNFKIGAKVVMLVNDSNGFYQNGTVGTITNISYVHILDEQKVKAMSVLDNL